jgi:3-oxoacyl-[acyl-carrier-protein] synthase II
MALQDSDLLLEEGGAKDPSIGLVCGTMFGSVHSIASFDWSSLEDGVKYVNPMLFPNTVINSPAGQAAIKHNLQGVNSTIAAGMTSGLYAIHYASEFIRLGRNKTLLAGGVEELCQESYLGLLKNGFLSPRSLLQPFGPQRDGTVQGEGTALWVLETEEGARQRGVKPLLEICGFGSAHDAHSVSAYQVRGQGAARAIESAIQAAGISIGDIGLIVANASGSRAADRMEANALGKVFGDHLEKIPVCAPKAAFGEALGASGALQAMVAAAALKRGEVPPTAGFSGTDTDLLLSDGAQELSGAYVLINSFGCDGNNTALIVKSCS